MPRESAPHRQSAFLIEAMLLLAFLVASLAVFTTLMATSVNQSKKAASLTHAIAMSQNAAEQFAVSPEGCTKTWQESDLTVFVQVEKGESSPGGTMWHAHIHVDDEYGEVWTLDTSRFVAQGGEAA